MGEGGSVDVWLARKVAKAEARWGWVDRSIRRWLGSGVVLGALAVGIPGGGGGVGCGGVYCRIIGGRVRWRGRGRHWCGVVVVVKGSKGGNLGIIVVVFVVEGSGFKE